MRKRKILSIITLGVFCTSMLFGCGNTEKNNDDENSSQSVAESSVSSESEKEEIVPNDASDFKWHEITADEYPDGVGGIAIDGYVGERTDVVIPKSISDKPVVMINDFAFCPYTEEELTFFDNGEVMLEPEYKLFELMNEKSLETIDTENSNDTESSNSSFDVLETYNNFDNLREFVKEHETVSKVTSILLPSTMEYIGKLSLGFCDSLERIEFYNLNDEKVPTVNCYYSPFFANSNLKSICFYLESERGNKDFFLYCPRIEEVYLCPGLRSIYNEDTDNYDEYYNVDLEWLNYSSELKKIHIAEGTYMLSSSHVYSITGEGEGVYTSRDYKISNPKYSNEASCKIYEDKVTAIYLPESLQVINNHIFCTHKAGDLTKLTVSEYENNTNGCEMYTGCTIIAPAGSYAESYAKENGIPYENP